MSEFTNLGASDGKTFKVSNVFLAIWVFSILTLACTLYLRHRIQNQTGTYPQKLSATIPERFGEWEVFVNGAEQIVNPQLEESLKDIYDDTLNRTYINRTTSKQVMISLAYGRDQSHEKQVHKPEVCYPAQGFLIDSVRKSIFRVADHDVPVTTMRAIKGPRIEYVAYWIVEGHSIVRGALQQNFRRTWSAFRGRQEDGLLFRVSLISNSESESITVLRDFSNSLVKSLDMKSKGRIVGAEAG